MLDSKTAGLTVYYHIEQGTDGDSFLWGYYCGSRPSLLKNYRIYTSPKTHKSVIEYKFPRWWGKKITRDYGDK